jgi:hypothetical protein
MDSLTRVEFAMAVEEAFGVEIEDDEAGRIKTVGQAAETVASLLVSQVSRTWQDLLAAEDGCAARGRARHGTFCSLMRVERTATVASREGSDG